MQMKAPDRLLPFAEVLVTCLPGDYVQTPMYDTSDCIVSSKQSADVGIIARRGALTPRSVLDRAFLDIQTLSVLFFCVSGSEHRTSKNGTWVFSFDDCMGGGFEKVHSIHTSARPETHPTAHQSRRYYSPPSQMDVVQGEEVWQIRRSAAGSHCTAAKICWGYRSVRARHAPTSLPPMGFHKICLDCLFYLHEVSKLVLIDLAVSPGQPGRV